MADVSNVSISVGDRFDTFDELAEKIQQYSDENYIQMWMRDARTIAAAAKRVPKRAAVMKPELKYYNLRYCCIHGGQVFRKKGEAVRLTK